LRTDPVRGLPDPRPHPLPQEPTMSQSAAVDTRRETAARAPDVPEDTTMTSLTAQESSRADAGLRRLEQVADEPAVETLLGGFLARRRGGRQARPDQAVRQARHARPVDMQRAQLSTGVTHLR